MRSLLLNVRHIRSYSAQRTIGNHRFHLQFGLVEAYLAELARLLTQAAPVSSSAERTALRWDTEAFGA